MFYNFSENTAKSVFIMCFIMRENIFVWEIKEMSEDVKHNN